MYMRDMAWFHTGRMWKFVAAIVLYTFGVFDVSELSNSIDRPHFAANQFLIDWIIQGGKSSG